jgi:hypothetical protein
MDYKQLKIEVSRQKETVKERYNYARSLGFTSYESRVLMSHSKIDIDRIHTEKLSQKDN